MMRLLRIVALCLFLACAACSVDTAPGAWQFDPSLPVDVSHGFTVAPGWTVTPSIKESLAPLDAGSGHVSLKPDSATVTVGMAF